MRTVVVILIALFIIFAEVYIIYRHKDKYLNFRDVDEDTKHILVIGPFAVLVFTILVISVLVDVIL